MKTKDLTGPALDWAVASSDGRPRGVRTFQAGYFDYHMYHYSTDWAQGGPIIERENITIIRADDDYETDADGFTTNKRIPQWFAECSRWTGHGLTTCYEGENMDPTFMISEDSGYYGPTPLIAAMRSFVASKLGDEVEIPKELL